MAQQSDSGIIAYDLMMQTIVNESKTFDEFRSSATPVLAGGPLLVKRAGSAIRSRAGVHSQFGRFPSLLAHGKCSGRKFRTAVLHRSLRNRRSARPLRTAAKCKVNKNDSDTCGEHMVPVVICLHESLVQPSVAGLDVEVMKKTDELLHTKVDNGEAPGIISVVYRNGVLAHLDCYGYADLERKVPFRPDTIVRLYSMTKCLVSIAVAICVEDGLLNFDDPVGKFIPSMHSLQVKVEDGELRSLDKPVTLLHLLTHTSGIGYGPMLGDDADGEAEARYVPLIERASLGRTDPSNPKALLNIEQWCDALAEVPLHFQPGSEWLYSYSHDVLGRVIEVVSGQRLDTFMQRRIFDVLGMVDTGFAVPKDKWGRVSGLYKREDATETSPAILKRLDNADSDKNEWMVGNASPLLAGGGSVDAMTGGVLSTAADYCRFCRVLLGKGTLDGVRFLKPETVEALTSNQLSRVTGADNCWAYGVPGVGFGLLGSVSVQHADLDAALRAGEYGWGGMAGTAWTNDPGDDFSLLSFSCVAFDLTTEEELRAGVRAAIAKFTEHEASSQSIIKTDEIVNERVNGVVENDAQIAPSTPSRAGPKYLSSTDLLRRKSGQKTTRPGKIATPQSTEKRFWRFTKNVTGKTPKRRMSPASLSLSKELRSCLRSRLASFDQC